MMRDELLRRIEALPPDADVGIQIGDDHLDITDVVTWGDGRFGALKCHPNDVCDLLMAWGLHNRRDGLESEPTKGPDNSRADPGGTTKASGSSGFL